MTETRKGMLLVISGPSGTGKGTLCSKLFSHDPSMHFSVSVTTRAPREGEIDGVHYHFVDNKRFNDLLEQGVFLENACVHNHHYGTLKEPILEAIDKGVNIVLDIDPQGARNVVALMPECVSVFILPPSYRALRIRLHTRNTDDPEEIERRLRNARGEVDQLHHYQYVIVNNDLDLAFDQLFSIVTAEKQRTTRYFPIISEE
jgi:guanylate kinase